MPKLIDREIFDSLRELESEQDPHFVKNFFNLYLDAIPKILEQIQYGLSENNAELLESSAHALKSSSLNAGATSLGELCADLEKLARAQNLNEFREKQLGLKSLIEQTRQEILSLI